MNISLQTKQAGLFKKLLEKPQAVWINPQNYKKYEKALPGLFKSCSLNDDFFLMSLFSGDKPIGVIYSDNQNAQPLTQEQFKHFKQAISLTAKAMALLTKRKKS